MDSKELTYLTLDKMRIDFSKHFSEEQPDKNEDIMAYKTKRYIRKLAMRKECTEIKPEQFMNDPKY